MKKINITVNGPIGAGKTTLIHELETRLRSISKSVVVQPEPSVTIPFINDVLKKFYTDNKKWSYSLQLCISAAQEAYMETLNESKYEYALFDAAYSSDIYGYSHCAHGRMTLDDFHALLNVGRPFKFDYLIWINANKDELIQHVKSRNSKITTGFIEEEKKDVPIEDFSYLDSHLKDFTEYKPIYFNRFKQGNKDVKIIELSNLPKLGTPEYTKLMDFLFNEITAKKV